MSTIFSKIIKGEIPSYKILESDNYYAFLDINPVAFGHVLVVPKIEIDYVFDVPDEILEGILPFSKRIARAVEKVVPCERIGIAVIGLEVPHAHVHLVPLQSTDTINFAVKKLSFDKEIMQDLAKKIQANI